MKKIILLLVAVLAAVTIVQAVNSDSAVLETPSTNLQPPPPPTPSLSATNPTTAQEPRTMQVNYINSNVTYLIQIILQTNAPCSTAINKSQSTESPIIRLDFQPMPPEGSVEPTLIRYKPNNEDSTLYWRQKISKFLQPIIEDHDNNPIYTRCRNGEPPEAGSTTVCDVTLDYWVACTSATDYNFNSAKGGPCIFLQLDKVFGWIPEYYNSSTIPSNMPQELRRHILNVEKQYGPDSNRLKVVWVSCEAQNGTDVENIGFIQYYPMFGFDGQYFPFLNVEHYISPVVAVHFEQPVRGVLINIECKAWANNIIHDRLDNNGYVHFQLMIDS